MTTLEKILKLSDGLPEAAQVKLLEFAESLCQRYQARKGPASAEGDSLATLCGGLENSETFAGEPIEIQRGLRGEWN